MSIRWCVFLCTLLLCSTLQVSAARGHSYPKSGGLSGSRSSGHSYPSSGGGLSGSGNRHPSSSGQAHAYPSSGGQSHAYPSSSGQSHAYPSSGGQSHGYPPAGSNHGYPPSRGGLSGNSPSRPASSNTYNTHHKTVVNNYHYTAPQQIRYTPPHGGAPVSYPVYHGTPPTYVYQYKDSGSKYGTLLAGLALLNLGTLAGVAYAHSGNSGHSSGTGYKAAPGEICKFGIKKDNGDYEETRIDCQLITSFIFQDQQAKAQNGGTNTTVVTRTVTNVTMVNGTNGGSEPAPAAVPGNIVYTMLPNGTLVPLNGTLVNGTFVQGVANATSPEPPSTNGMTSSVSTTTTNTTTTIVNAVDVKGKEVQVTPGMQCYVIRHTSSSNMKKSVPCGLLQSYATQSLKKNSAVRNLPVFTMVAVVAAMIVAY